MTSRLGTLSLGSKLQMLKYTNSSGYAHGQYCRCHTVPNLEVAYRNYIWKEVGDPDVLNAEYTISDTFLALQQFSYVPRTKEERQVVELFEFRQKLRINNPPGLDKSSNPMVAVSGSPGIGKSAFLANFPLSTAYQAYCSASKVIMAPFTFNSAMDWSTKNESVVGLRILYGAAWSMHKSTINPQKERWEHFFGYFKKFADIRAVDALRLLKTVYEPHKVLLLVDEIAKSQNDTAVMKELASVIIHEADVDILMTSLSTQYVENLVVSSQHPIFYIILPTIPDSNIGKEECHKWAEAVIAKHNVKDVFHVNLLRSAHLFASGHPRSVETLVSMGFNPETSDNLYWSRTHATLMDPSITTTSLLHAINSDVVGITTKNQWKQDIASEEVLEIILTTLTNYAAFKPIFRTLLEDGAIFAVPAGHKDYLASIRISQLLELLPILRLTFLKHENHDPTLAYNKISALQCLGSEMIMKDKSPISRWWEACVILTIYCRSVERFYTNEVLGISLRYSFKPSMKLRIITDENRLKIKLFKFIENEIIVPPQGQSGGYDVRVTYNCDEGILFVYGQMKIGPSKSDDFPENTRAKSIVNTLINHLKSLPTLYLKDQVIDTTMKNVVIIFYEWSDERNKLCRESVLIQARHIFAETPNKYHKHIDHFISNYGTSNIYYFGKAMLDGWLIPSVTVIPRLVEAVTKP